MKNKLTIIGVSLLVVVIAFLAVVLFASPDVKGKEKVTVYVFSADGCPYCEEQMKYLKSLNTYGEEFEIVEKELYIDHIDWEHGKDYQLGMDVGKLFESEINGTPFVVVSNIYAKTGYNDSLKDTITRAYNLGHIDVVSCVSKGYKNCLESKYNPEKEKEYLPVRIIELITIAVGIVLIILFVMILRQGKK